VILLRLKYAAILMFLIFLALPWRAFSDDTRVSATVDTGRIGENDQITLHITIEGPDSSSAQAVEVASSNDFRLISGPNVSTQFRMVNGRTSTSKTLSYVFFPMKKGTLTLPVVKIKVGGEIQATQPVEVEVVEGSVKKSRPSRRRSSRDPFESLFDDRRSSSSTKDVDVGDDVFVRMELSKSQVYIGETTELSLLLFYRPNIPITGCEKEEEGKFIGVGYENIDLSAQGKNLLEQRHEKARLYYVQPLAKWVLFPTRHGAFTIEPWILKIGIRSQSRSFFSFGRQQVILRKTNSLTLNVKDFPLQDRPADFSGLCGRFNLSAKVDKTDIQAGDAVTYTLTLQGTGNLRSLGDFALPEIPHCKVYTPKVKDNIRLDGGNYKGSRIWEFVLVPLGKGRLRIPPVHLEYFNSKNSRYHRLQTKALDIDVAPGETGNGLVTPVLTTGLPLELKGKDIRYIHIGSAPAKQKEARIYRQTWFIAALVILPLFALGLILLDERQRRRKMDARNWARSRAAVKAKKALKKCSRLGRKGFSDPFFQALYELFQSYLKDRFALNRIELTGTRLRQQLSDSGVEIADIDELIGLLNLCGSFRYAPSDLGESDPQKIIEKTRLLLVRLEEAQT